jgi:8-oxo-dGTP pyrophosphatase MutT (NUDIX family)
MHRSHILEMLQNYASVYLKEKETVQRFEQFVQSAFVLSPDRSSILLALHAKLNKWLQLGGHADGCSRVEEVAFREAVEESGIEKLRFYSQATPIDVDIHEVPGNKNVKAHLHYDVRFLLISNDEQFVCSNESLALKWVPLEDFYSYCQEPSLMRAVKKINSLRARSESVALKNLRDCD